jgi:hypothetical protein
VAPAAVEVKITGEDGGIAVRAYTQLLSNVRFMLEEIDRLSVPGNATRLEWAVRFADTEGSLMRVILLPRTVPARRDPDSLSVPPLALVDGVRLLASVPEIPPLFSEPVVSRVGQVGQQIGKSGITGVSMISLNGQPSPEAPVTEAVKQNARRAVEPASVAWSSVVGVLDLISARREKRRIGLLTDQGRAVVCNVERLPRDLVFQAFEKRVVAAGRLRRNSRGQPVRLDAESIEVLSTEGDHVRARELLGAGVGIIDPADPEEFMAVLRDRQ